MSVRKKKDVGVRRPAVQEIEGDEAEVVAKVHLDARIGKTLDVRFRDLALHEHGVLAPLEDLADCKQGRPTLVDERVHVGRIASLLLVPKAEFAAEARAHQHLVHRRVELDPRIALGKRAGVPAEELRPVPVLEIADPVGNAEMTEVDDGNDAAVPQCRKHFVRERPVVASRTEVHAVIRQAVTKIARTDRPAQREVLAPRRVMFRRFELVAPASPLDGRVTAFDPRRHHPRLRRPGAGGRGIGQRPAVCGLQLPERGAHDATGYRRCAILIADSAPTTATIAVMSAARTRSGSTMAALRLARAPKRPRAP